VRWFGSISCLTGLSPMSSRTRRGQNPVLWRLRSHRRGWHSQPRFQRLRTTSRTRRRSIQLDSESALLTRRKDGTLVLAVWNYAPPEQSGSPRKITLRFKNTNQKHASVSRVDGEHGDVRPAYEKMEVRVTLRRNRFRNFAVRRISPRPKPTSPARRVNHNSAQPWAGGNRTQVNIAEQSLRG